MKPCDNNSPNRQAIGIAMPPAPIRSRRHARLHPLLSRWRQALLTPLAGVFVSLLLLCPTTAMAGKVLNDALVTRPFGHHIWQDVLTRTMTPTGEVAFVPLRAEPRRLNQYLGQLAAVSPDSHPAHFPTPEHVLAYWINAHNALALRLILDAYPVSELSQIPDWGTNSRYRVGQQPTSLDDIRHKLLAHRHRYPDLPFALSDYSQNSPAILPRAYQGDTLATQLAHARQRALQQNHLVRFQRVEEDSGCIQVQASADLHDWLSQAPPPAPFAHPDDQDSLQEPARNASETPESSPHEFPTEDPWRALAPPDIYADWHRRCSAKVEIRPPITTLRQVKAP